MDLNNFKKVNDTFGHSVGDDCLKKFSEKAMEMVSDKGSVYRMSGDEFVCLYRGDKIDLFLAAFDEKITNFLKTDIHFLGISIGYAKFPQDANTIDELIKKADRAMYKAKEQSKG
jgi:diguanylate cyclase (GGDEF)-like protein